PLKSKNMLMPVAGNPICAAWFPGSDCTLDLSDNFETTPVGLRLHDPGPVTVNRLVPLTGFDPVVVAVMTAMPGERGVARPVLETVAIDAFADVQVKAVPATALPDASEAVAWNCTAAAPAFDFGGVSTTTSVGTRMWQVTPAVAFSLRILIGVMSMAVVPPPTHLTVNSDPVSPVDSADGVTAAIVGSRDT